MRSIRYEFTAALLAAAFFFFLRISHAESLEEPEQISNPFLTDEEVLVFGSQDRNITWTDPHINAIFYSSRSSTVVISGRVLGVNDFIDGRQIIAIRPEALVLKDKKGTYVVKMGSVLQKQPSLAAKAN
jgi:hypothetical protein